MAITKTSGSPALPPTTAKESSFNPSQYLSEQLTSGESAKYIKDEMGESYSKNFERRVKDAVGKLGSNATQEDVDKAISKETTNQVVVKSIVGRATSKIMARYKELQSDSFE